MPVNRTQIATAAADIKAKAEALKAALEAFCALSHNITDYEGSAVLRSTCEHCHTANEQIISAANAAAVWLAANPEE